MEKISIIRVSSIYAWLSIVLGGLSAVFGVINLIEPIYDGLNLREPSGGLNGIFFILQGVIFITWGFIYLYNRKFYIEWDEKELHLLLPGTKRPEKINIEEIRSVNIKLFEIELTLDDSIRVIDLNSMRYEEMKRVKEKFDSIKKSIQKA